MKRLVFRFEVVYSLRTIKVNLSLDFRGVQKEKGKLVFSKSVVFYIWHIVSFVAQRHNVVKFHKLGCS